MNTAVAWSVKPIILGSDTLALRIASRLFFRHWICSCIFDSRISFIFRLCLFSKFRKIPIIKSDFLMMELERFTQEFSEWSTFLLIPTTAEYRNFVISNRNALEKRFIILTPESIFENGYLFAINRHN